MGDNQAYFQRVQQWQEYGFQRVNHVTQQTGLVDRIHQFLQSKGLNVECYLVMDADELSAGFPMAVRTRYIMPVFKDEATGAQLAQEALYPGIAIAELLGFHRGIDVQIGLDSSVMRKIGLRGNAINEREGSEREIKKPDWWNHDYFVEDITRDYDFNNGESKPFGKEDGFIVYLWGNANSNVDDIPYETEDPNEEGIQHEWADVHPEVDEAFKKLEAIINSAANKS